MFKSSIFLMIAAALFAGSATAAPIDVSDTLFMRPGSPLYMFNPNVPTNIIKRSPIVRPPGSQPLYVYDPLSGEPRVNILKREPIVLESGSEPLFEFNPDLPMQLLKRSPLVSVPGSNLDIEINTDFPVVIEGGVSF